jgi:hypothetical protein
MLLAHVADHPPSSSKLVAAAARVGRSWEQPFQGVRRAALGEGGRAERAELH